MEIAVHIVPPGGGEMQFTIPISEESFYRPIPGDYLNFREDDGLSAFYVLEIHHFYEKLDARYMAENIVIEAEPVILPEGIGSEAHKNLCESMNVSRRYPDNRS
ncbi:hypothetical protein QWY16_11675 [Planococcus shenhongbingii]|uniref:hypothetical protein n=1 Tax=Planococcus shenhongbingii TaxID=3058398 RepID=UPI002612E4B7|nr:hypothetical protein [Planococcus sp. N016]WKA57160.1 hypothetical protein QWY16_11675 [Planococcus sp. N016]